ncbi:hypothetical protein CIPAW_16G044400, partial [Carya illinoinensis]
YFVFICCFVSSITFVFGTGNETDRLSLLDFKAKITHDPLGFLSSCNDSIHFCSWQGVTCGRKHHDRVTKLDVRSQNLGGSISSQVGNLSFLRELILSNNSFIHIIPPEVERLRRLQILAIGNNSISGQMPSNISSCTNLIFIEVYYNKLFGEIPAELCTLPKLLQLSLYNNNLTGSIPPSFGNSSSLKILDVVYNNLGGSIPESFGQLTKLISLSLGTNRFAGLVPPSIFNLSSITVFDMYSNKLSGKVPSIEMLYRLEAFSIHSNRFGHGGGNDLSFLCSLTNATDLRILSTGNNNLGGVLPNCISNFSTTLSILGLGENRISGSIPRGIGNLINLEWMEIGRNKISGNIPSEISYLEKLRILDLYINNLSGNIPPSLGNLTLRIKLYLGMNNLHGAIPPSLAKCQNLVELFLSSNKLSGVIPPQVMSLISFSLIAVDLSANQFTGILPMEMGNFKNLERFDISENKLFGEIPARIELLDLSYNNLSGEIPKFLERFNFLQQLNLSYNYFEGEVRTKGVFHNASATSVQGNGELCGGITEFELPKCKFKRSQKGQKLTLTLKLIISLLAALLGITLVLLCLLFSLRKKRKENPSRNSENSLLNVSYQSLLKATNGFSLANLIGVGSFGSVYKGILDQDSRTIAVKVLNLLRHGASKSFIAECEALRNVRHRNLVKVLSACSSADFQGHDFEALVYEFMVNGNLDEWLHPNPKTNDDEALKKRHSLSLLQRLNIAIDVANTLEYLHHRCDKPIVHCDLKPRNVLLDEEMIAHVGDFGLSRFLIEHTHDLSTNQSSSVGVRGTVGYAPPEVTTYGDVYSYGILLLEMFIGKRPTDDMFKDSFMLHEFHGEIRTNETPNYQSQIRIRSKIREGLSLILGIGVACSMEFPRERMNIKDVLKVLHSIREKTSWD